MAEWPKYEPTMELRFVMKSENLPIILQQKHIKYMGNFISDIPDQSEEVWLDVPVKYEDS